MNTMSCSDSPTNMDCCPGHSRNLVVEHGDISHQLGVPFRIFSKFVRVFDLYFVATKSSPDDRLLHGACGAFQVTVKMPAHDKKEKADNECCVFNKT